MVSYPPRLLITALANVDFTSPKIHIEGLDRECGFNLFCTVPWNGTYIQSGVDPNGGGGGCMKCACKHVSATLAFKSTNQVWAHCNCDTIIKIGINKHEVVENYNFEALSEAFLMQEQGVCSPLILYSNTSSVFWVGGGGGGALALHAIHAKLLCA